MILETIELQKPAKRPLFAQMTADTGTLTINGTPAFALYGSDGAAVDGYGPNVTGQTAGAAAIVESWFNLDSANLSTGEYRAVITMSATASSDSLQRTETYEYLIIVLPAVPTEAGATAEARAQIVEMGEAEEYPALTARQVEFCLQAARRRDINGYEPTESTWTPTYDIAAGVALAWRLKAGKAAAKFDFSTDNQKLSRSQVHKHCLEMAAMWEAQQSATSGQMTTYEDISVNPDDIDLYYGLEHVRMA